MIYPDPRVGEGVQHAAHGPVQRGQRVSEVSPGAGVVEPGAWHSTVVTVA